MITVDRDGSRVRLSFDVNVPNYEVRRFTFYWECPDNVYAGFLSNEMREQMQHRLEDIRRAAYEQGWKDAKGKRGKRSWFFCGWQP